MRDLPLNSLRAFAAVHLAGGIRPAGRALGVSHSSVARHVAELEALVGAPLVERDDGARALAFTPLGERLGQEAAKSLGALDRTWSAAREQRSANAVTISAAPSFAALWLLSRLPRLAEAHPRIEVSVLAEQRLRAPEEEGSDLSIRMGRPRKGERAIALMDDGLVPVASSRLLAKARAARGGPTGGATVATLLRDLPLLHDRDPNAGWSMWTERHGPGDADLASGSRFSSSDLVLRAAKQGQGVALARLRLAEDDLASGTLERLSDETVLLPNAYWIVLRDEGTNRASIRAVRDWLIEEGSASVSR
ncbi:LysR substrate-binding domain-containing protein [Fulvimarina sp. MAC8]|uniref:LysR substrate-binding domain-containing protein n=1 Tax=Fulvimarina sp. MAC8 TaxID=3162874 RepID=UPI0032EE6676